MPIDEAHVRRRHRWPWVALAIAVPAVVVGAAVMLMWGGRGAREASIDETVEEYRRAPGRDGSGFLQPTPGVYTYRGRGTERLSLLGAQQQWGSQIPGTVTATDPGCWRFRVEYNENHAQELDFCARPTELVIMAGRVTQRFDFGGFTIDEGNEFVCDPPGTTVRVTARSGDSWRYSCVGRNLARDLSVRFTDTYTFLGRRRLSGREGDIEAYAYRVVRTLRGDQSGREDNELWFSTSSGLPVRVQRDAQLKIPSMVGTVTYTERGSFTLTSVTPRE